MCVSALGQLTNNKSAHLVSACVCRVAFYSLAGQDAIRRLSQTQTLAHTHMRQSLSLLGLLSGRDHQILQTLLAADQKIK